MIRWLLSPTIRDACAMRKHVYRILCAQRDLMAPSAVALVSGALGELQKAIHDDHVDKTTLKQRMVTLEQIANKWLRPYPHPQWRENVEVLLVALAVAMAIRTFFLQPFKIPTGSMQPTLFGVTSVPDFSRVRSKAEAEAQAKLAKELVIPSGWERVKDWFKGISYLHIVAQNDGELQAVYPPQRLLIFNIKQTIVIGGVPQTVWFPPDYGEQSLVLRAGLLPSGYGMAGHYYHKGDDVVKLAVGAGDHLFVDRLTYNFRKPQRGEIVVFATAGIPEDKRNDPLRRWQTIPPDEFYIKRLVGLGGEKIQIGDDRHLVIDGKRLDSSTPHFEGVYSFNTNQPPQDSKFSGHISLQQMPYFPDSSTVYQIPDGHVMVMGDNTVSSLDSRYWGDIPDTSIIGKSFFVYWPITDRFGIGSSTTAK